MELSFYILVFCCLHLYRCNSILKKQMSVENSLKKQNSELEINILERLKLCIVNQKPIIGKYLKRRSNDW